MASRYLRTGAAADFLGVGVQTLRDYVHQGVMTPDLVTPGGQFRWDTDTLQAYKARLTTGVPSSEMQPASTAERPLKLVRFRRIPPRGSGSGSSFAEQVEKQGQVPSTALVRVALIRAPGFAARVLDLAPGEKVLIRERRMQADGVPVQLAAAYYPQSIAGGVELAGPPDGGPAVIYPRLAERGYRVTRITESTTARKPTPREAKALQVTASQCLLETLRLAHDDSGRTLEATFNVFPADRWHLSYEWRDTDD